MRKLFVLIAASAALISGRAMAKTPTLASPTPASFASTEGEIEDAMSDESGEGNCDCDAEGGCGKDGCGRHGRRNANRWFNCNCNGSYKFPVPPLYTYHWPGLYSMKRMTDYHSPWRFPAIKPYEEETPVRDLSRRPEFRQASAALEIDRTQSIEEESVSAKIMRHYATEQ